MLSKKRFLVKNAGWISLLSNYTKRWRVRISTSVVIFCYFFYISLKFPENCREIKIFSTNMIKLNKKINTACIHRTHSTLLVRNRGTKKSTHHDRTNTFLVSHIILKIRSIFGNYKFNFEDHRCLQIKMIYRS